MAATSAAEKSVSLFGALNLSLFIDLANTGSHDGNDEHE